jgi:hypothetical protein
MRPLALCILLLLGGCSSLPGSSPLVPLRHLVDDRRADGTGAEVPSLTLGSETRYVLAPRVAGKETRLELSADAEGRVEAALACPPELAGRSAQAVVESAGVVSRDSVRFESLDMRHEQRIVQCPASAAATVPLGVAARTGSGLVLLRAVVSALPTSHAEIDLGVVPSGARLRLGVGVRRLGAPPAGTTLPAMLRIEGSGGKRLVLWQDDLAVPGTARDERWHDVDVSLDPIRAWLGSSLRLVFDGSAREGNGWGAVVAWGDPTLWGPATGAPLPPWNVLLVSLDTLRADRLGTYGYPLDVSPAIDRLAREGTVLETAVTQATWTLPSHLTMLTGTYPCVHGFVRQAEAFFDRAVPRAIVPLAETLRRAGFATAAFTEDAYVDAAHFQRGFGSFRADHRTEGERTAGMVDATVDAAVAWLEAWRRERFFLFVHTYQVHAPYTPPPAFLSRVSVGTLPLPPEGAAPSEAAYEDAVRYVGEVAYTDAVLAKLFAALDELGLAERTIVLVTSDHGEAFGEHRVTGHGNGLYEEEVRVPMIWRAPGLVRAGRRVTGLAGLVDVTPTVLDLLGLPIAPWMQGKSLAAPLTSDAAGPLLSRRVLPMQSFFADGVRGHLWKVMSMRGGDRFHDLRGDAEERRPLRDASRWRGAVTEARSRLALECRQGLAALGPPEKTGGVPSIDPERDLKLRALGYVE